VTDLLTDLEVDCLFGSLMKVLNACPAAEMRNLAGDAGFDRSQIPDGIAEDGIGLRRPPIHSGIDGQWNSWDGQRRRSTLPKLAEAIEGFCRSRGGGREVNAAILKHGFRFENGGFVPVDALGNMPS